MVFLCSPRWQLFQNIVKGNLKLSQLKWYILMGAQIFILNYLSTIWRFLYLILRVQLESPWRLRRYYNFCYIICLILDSWNLNVSFKMAVMVVVFVGVCVYMCLFILLKFMGGAGGIVLFHPCSLMLSYLFVLDMCCQLAAYICLFSVWFLFLLFLSHHCFFGLLKDLLLLKDYLFEPQSVVLLWESKYFLCWWANIQAFGQHR